MSKKYNASNINAPAADFVFCPSLPAVQDGNIYSIFSELMANMALVQGPKQLFFDGEFVAGITTIPAGPLFVAGSPDAAYTFSTPTMTLTDSGAAFTNALIGKRVFIDGATTAANNGYFTVTGVPSATTLEYTNSAGVAEAQAGTYAVLDDWDMKDVEWGNSGTSLLTCLEVGEGCTFVNLRDFTGLKFGPGDILNKSTTTSPMSDFKSGVMGIIKQTNTGSNRISSDAGAKPFIHVTEPGSVVLMSTGAFGGFGQAGTTALAPAYDLGPGVGVMSLQGGGELAKDALIGGVFFLIVMANSPLSGRIFGQSVGNWSTEQAGLTGGFAIRNGHSIRWTDVLSAVDTDPLHYNHISKIVGTGAETLTLPLANHRGYEVIKVKNTGAGTVTVDTTGAETIVDASGSAVASVVIAAGSNAEFISNNLTSWELL